MILCTYLTLEEKDNAPELALNKLTRELSDLFADVATDGNLSLIPSDGVIIPCGTLSQDQALARISTANNYYTLMGLAADITISIDVIQAVN